MKDQSKSGNPVPKHVVIRPVKTTKPSSIAGGDIIAVLETLQRIGNRPIRSAKSVEEVSFGRIFADGIYNAE